MNAEFNWWLLIVGLVVGAGLVWFVVLDARRRDVDIDDEERPREAAWLASVLADEGHDVSPAAAERLLMLHRTYLEGPPPDDPAADPLPDPPRDPRPDAGTSEVADDDRLGAERSAVERDE
ncbi:MAG: hypothetical protein ACRDIL_04990 [Candidatus Limnocylindrales bacterium]